MTLVVIKHIAGFKNIRPSRQLLIALLLFAGTALPASGQVYIPIFKSVEKQPTVAPLEAMVEGDFFGQRSVAAVSESEKAIYFFTADSSENFELANVVTLPDTPVAISKGREVVIESNGHKERLAKLAVLMKHGYVVLLSFGADGQPVLSSLSGVDPYCTGVRAVDLQTSGKLDLIAYGKFSLGVSVESNLGQGKFKPVPSMPGPLGNVPFSDVAFTDFNGDLVPDMAALDWVNRKLLIFYGRGDGTFAQPVSFQLKAEPSALSVADLNGNGYPDIVVGYSRLDRIDIFGGDGFGRFFLRQTIKTVAPVSQFAIADYTGDGTMDIAALSRSAGEIMLFSYDPLSRRFRYSGVIGAGESFEHILPFYFQNRIKADLVASSSRHKFVKVFKSALNFSPGGDRMVPVGANTSYLSACGNDSACYLIALDDTGRISARYSISPDPGSVRTAVDWQSEGTPGCVRLLSGTQPFVIVSYKNVDLLSLYEVGDKSSGVTEMKAETAFLPFAMAGSAAADSASMAAAYRLTQDSTVAVSYFTAVKGKSEFLEHDYSVNDTERYLASSVAISPTLAFLRVWRLSRDSLQLACTSLRSSGTTLMTLKARGVRFLNMYGQAFPLLALQGNDTLGLYSLTSGPVGGFSVTHLISTPFDSANFGSIRITPVSDSTYYMTYVSRANKSVFLYELSPGQLRFRKAWHMSSDPADIALSPELRTVYFLNRNQSYVSVHTF